LKRAPGVAFASVSFSNKLAVIAYDTNRISAKALKKVIVEAGFEAKPAKP
jgi:copper chaperone CopZ